MITVLVKLIFWKQLVLTDIKTLQLFAPVPVKVIVVPEIVTLPGHVCEEIANEVVTIVTPGMSRVKLPTKLETGIVVLQFTTAVALYPDNVPIIGVAIRTPVVLHVGLVQQ
jgi:hypothetical protein